MSLNSRLESNEEEEVTEDGCVDAERLPHLLESGGQSPPRDWYFIAEQPAPAPHLAHPEGCAALRIVLVTVPRVSRSCENFPDGFDLHLLSHHRCCRAVIKAPLCLSGPTPS